jgi:1-acyl-sn-glycerol-3-phosphate acyltransferase
VRFVFRTRWLGREEVPPEGGYVLAANHVSNFDVWPLALGLFPRRWLRFMAKSELFWPPLGTLLSASGVFSVRRGEGDVRALATAVRLCRDGHVVFMFPEGTRRAKGMWKKHEARAHTGAAWIALKAAVPLVPAAVAGTDRLLRLGPLAAAYGEPVRVDDLAGLPTREAAQIATDRLMAAIAALERSLERGERGGLRGLSTRAEPSSDPVL